jgi:dTDP-4-amino-4,6-dideoxygalactose transaminase
MRYLESFADLPVGLPAVGPPSDIHSWHLFVLRILDEAPLDRDAFIAAMAQAGIACSVHFIPLHLHPYWRDRYQLHPADFPVAHESFRRVVSLPAFSSMTDAQVEQVVTAVRCLLG